MSGVRALISNGFQRPMAKFVTIRVTIPGRILSFYQVFLTIRSGP
jgi:hypothetical protein